jgi:hypothetical protein
MFDTLHVLTLGDKGITCVLKNRDVMPVPFGNVPPLEMPGNAMTDHALPARQV